MLFRSWSSVQAGWKVIADFLAVGTSSDAAAANYSKLQKKNPDILASLLNLATAMAAIHLAHGTPLDYIREIEWDSTMAQDRFFGYADPDLLLEVTAAAQHDEFDPEHGSWVFHPGASKSFKQNRFGEANVQLTFHEEDTKMFGSKTCIKVEPDIDYYKDPGAHAVFEVVHNTLSGCKTDPRMVYVLRWIAGQHAGIPEFVPPYTIE